jgi:hypothetical protein
MTEKLSFTPVEGHVVIDFTNKKTKITPYRAIDIALRILSKVEWKVLEDYFHPVYIAMFEDKKANATVPKNDNGDDEPPEPEAA